MEPSSVGWPTTRIFSVVWYRLNPIDGPQPVFEWPSRHSRPMPKLLLWSATSVERKVVTPTPRLSQVPLDWANAGLAAAPARRTVVTTISQLTGRRDMLHARAGARQKASRT